MKSIPFFFILIILSISCNQKAKNKPFWPENKSPEKIGKLAINDFFSHKGHNIADSYGFTAIHYAEACAAFGVARMASSLNDTESIERLSQIYLKVITDSIPNTANHVDANVYGILPFELYKLTGNQAFYQQAIKLTDSQWENPLKNGLSNQTRFWIDDIWMIGSLQVQAFRITKNPIYIERAALEIASYLEKLQKENGLFFHGSDIPFHWGRGNGWVAAGLAELLSELPKSNEHYHTIVNGYIKMMDALVKYQADDGMWRQLVDYDKAWKETSSTAMFGYAMVLGVKKGILKDEKYTTSYKKAWLALCDYVTPTGKITDVCVGTGQQNDIQYYLMRPRTTGDFHGQAPLLWFAWSLISL